MPATDYQPFAAQFNRNKSRAEQWAYLAHDAGMKYLGPTTKHPDGFAMFHSQASACTITNATPFRR